MAHGGARPGAGRKPGGVARIAKAAALAPALTGQTPLAFLESIMNSKKVPLRDRIDAARAMLPYVHRKLPLAVEHSGKDGQPLQLIVDTGLVEGVEPAADG